MGLPKWSGFLKQVSKFSIAVSVMAAGMLAWANTEPDNEATFGPEFAVTNSEIFGSFPSGRLVIETTTSVDAIEFLVAHIKAKFRAETGLELKHQTLIKRRGAHFRTHHRVIFPNGFYIELLPDPGVIEVITKPGTVSEFRANRELIQRYFFDAAKERELEAWDFAGGGHIHIGTVFKNDPRLLRNFMVDYFNHPSLSSGALGNDPYNALSLPQMSESHREAFKSVLEDFDRGRIRTTEALARAVIDRVYKGHELDPYWASKERQWFNRNRPARTHALNLKQLLDGLLGSGIGTVEIRSLYPQKNADQFLLLIELFARRITMLKKLDQPLEYNAKAASASPEEALREFANYISETGLEPSHFSELIHPQWRRSGLTVNSAMTCQKVFAP